MNVYIFSVKHPVANSMEDLQLSDRRNPRVKNSTFSVKNKPTFSNQTENDAYRKAVIAPTYQGIDGSLRAGQSMFLFILARNSICNEQ
ncbi:MAG: hypothetical protein ACJ0BN_03315 [Limisphaerales bacterium]|nr:hypothetical protein [Pedosphaera sp.]MBL6842567.1 hypothetical protein [Verrucomicrobiae bacterium]HAR00095.1 hypothetical protein [Verrucomicrobiales bacterium]HBP55641.1 hypothetical protein [Verrucomicrobiales bacterium]HCP37723.1 hypothetical protein [Verrucomicrobiales bacterium]|tara:strand:- start:1255 stop:1518 length:264 start_codon:yes stop_codon:yes gene_type:complete